MCFNRRALIKANTVPIPADAKNIVKKVLKPEARASSASESGIRDTVLVNTMAMASEEEKWRNFFFIVEI